MPLRPLKEIMNNIEPLFLNTFKYGTFEPDYG